ncbi:MAG TPA: SMI1/KNR4 family protein [Thiotrichaceae bacterium]|nr:SMI1/KNR4 family protein [Thiotrichaceae bacterium]
MSTMLLASRLLNDIEETESRLEVNFPEQVKSFYKHINGMAVDEPK